MRLIAFNIRVLRRLRKQSLLCVLLLTAIFVSCQIVSKPVKETSLPPGVPEEKAPPPPEPAFLSLVAAGDNLFHDVILTAYRGKAGYNFESIYDEIEPVIEAADIAYINQETVFGGSEVGFSGYPRFNTPEEAGGALLEAGFDIVNHATNHIMDKGEKAVFATIDYWENKAVYLGIHRSAEARGRPVIVEKNTVRIGFLSYTYGTNGLPVPKDKPYLVSLINKETMAREIDALRPLCDFLVVSMHWGEEYSHEAGAAQKELGAFLAEHLVDLVIGHHPHVIEPVVNFKRPDGGTTLCFYSLGNFISAQVRPSTMLGGLMYVKLKKTETVSIEEAAVIPTVTHYEKGFLNFKVYPLYAYTEELAARHHLSPRKEISAASLNALAKNIFGERVIFRNPFDENGKEITEDAVK